MPHIPPYLGRILDTDGIPVGTCFQVSPGLLVTAWHILDNLATTTVTVEALNGSNSPAEATVARTDPLHDLAVLRVSVPLAASVPGLFATDWVDLTTPVVVTGVSQVDDSGREYTHLDAPGTWSGGTMRDRQVPLGRLTSPDVVPGMSGAPVRRLSDDLVVGVVSARYNTADGWLQHSVWIARTENLHALLDGLAEVEVAGPSPLHDAVDLIFTVSESTVRLTGPQLDVSAPHGGVRPGLAAAVDDVRRERARVAVTSRADSEGSATGPVSLRRAGELLADSFLPEPVSTALAGVLRRAGKEHVPLRIGMEATNLGWLPWEALPEPLTFRPLALHPLITAYRKVAAPEVRPVPGPLRIVVAIAAPLRGGGPTLDYERELRNVLASVKGARQGEADVRVVPFATTAAIRAALDEAPAHVLHLSCHGGPGILELEDDEGTARRVTAEEFVDEAIPPGQMPPVLCLAACYTDTPAAKAPSVAAQLIERGASVVVGAETSVTDWYATALYARIYQELAQSATPDVVSAVADARRLTQLHLAASQHPRDAQLAGLDEWSVVTVLAASGSTRVFDPALTAPVPEHRRAAVSGLLSRDIGEFVGRRREQRELPAVLTGSTASGIVLHGIGGVGKTTLASELIHHLDSPLVAVVAGEVSVDTIFTTVTGVLRRHLARIEDQGRMSRAVQYVSRVDEPWQDRFAELREQVLGRLPVLLVLDNFEDNLTPDRELRDDMLAALLARWAADPGASRLLVTSRYEFSLPDQAENHLRFQVVGPMSMAETFKLIWALPALDRLEDPDLERVWRLVGGHPRSLEYLDALLNNGQARFHDVTARLTRAAQSHPEALTAPTLDAALAQTLTLIADDILLDELLTRLTPDAQQLLLGTSVYREPVDLNAILFQIGNEVEAPAYQPDRQTAMEQIKAVLANHGFSLEDLKELNDLPVEVLAQIRPAAIELLAAPTVPRSTPADLPKLLHDVAATSLLTIDHATDLAFVHRWTASELERRWRDQGQEDQIHQAHAQAAEYWLWRYAAWPQDGDANLHDALEARFHLLAANETDRTGQVTEWACSRLRVIGAWDHETALIHDTLTRLSPDSPHRAAWLHRLGMLAQARGDYVEAERRYHQSLTISEELGDRQGMADSYHELGNLVFLQGDYVEAERRYHQSSPSPSARNSATAPI